MKSIVIAFILKIAYKGGIIEMNNDICKVKTEDELVKSLKNNENYRG